MRSTPMVNPIHLKISLTLIAMIAVLSLPAQQITGVWKGKIDRKKVEVKIIQNGDSLAGTAYYYESPTQYRRYSIKGYFDPNDNSVVWWDDRLIEEKGSRLTGGPGKIPQLSVADFNCPNGGEMYLEGKSVSKEDQDDEKNVNLTKVPLPGFRDEWDYVIQNFTRGMNDPEVIDSVSLVAFRPDADLPRQEKAEPIPPRPPKTGMVSIPPMRQAEPKAEPAIKPETPVTLTPPAPLTQTIEEKFTSRKKDFTLEIPLAGDSIELRFYDNAEIDGDSISLFLNNHMIFTHIRLAEKAYTIKLAVSDLSDANELIMVAENLGTIPPNTSYLVAIVDNKRYEAKLASTENSSALVRLRKP